MRTGFVPPPRALRKATLDNLVLVPASLLPYKEQWQGLANELPRASTLIVLPAAEGPQKTALQAVARGLRAKGRPVTTVQADAVHELVRQESV